MDGVKTSFGLTHQNRYLIANVMDSNWARGIALACRMMLWAANHDTWASASNLAVPSALLLLGMFSSDRPDCLWSSH